MNGRKRIMIFLCFFLQPQSLVFANPPSSYDSVASINMLSIDIYHQLKTEGNHFFSPYTIATLLSAMWLGAGGKTKNELGHILKYNETNSDDDYRIQQSYSSLLTQITDNFLTANRVFVNSNYRLHPDYKKDLVNFYNMSIEKVDFWNDTALQLMNTWIRDTTKSGIRDFFTQKPLTNTLIILISSIHYKGTWLKQFDKKKTHLDTFYNRGVTPKQIPMMSQKAKVPYGYDVDLDSFIIELQYGKGVSMYILLPRERTGYQKLDDNLTAVKLKTVIQNLYENEVEITIPKFELNTQYELVPLVKSLGAETLFDPTKADLSGMSNVTGLFVSSIFHGATINVDEEGTEASSATAVVVETLSLKPSFYVDHPFFFFIHDNLTGLILFVGRVQEL